MRKDVDVWAVIFEILVYYISGMVMLIAMFFGYDIKVECKKKKKKNSFSETDLNRFKINAYEEISKWPKWKRDLSGIESDYTRSD